MRKSSLFGIGPRALVLAALISSGQVSAAAPKEHITRDNIVQYYKLFNAEDRRYAEFLDKNVVFDHPTAGTLRGREAVVAFYKKLWDSGVREHREPVMIVIDNAQGLVAAQLDVHLTAKSGITPTLPSGEVIKPGEEWVGHNVIFYKIRNGKIVSIIGGNMKPFAKSARP